MPVTHISNVPEESAAPRGVLQPRTGNGNSAPVVAIKREREDEDEDGNMGESTPKRTKVSQDNCEDENVNRRESTPNPTRISQGNLDSNVPHNNHCIFNCYCF